MGVFATATLPVERPAKCCRKAQARLLRTHGRAEHLARKQPACRERLVAYHLGAETEARAA